MSTPKPYPWKYRPVMGSSEDLAGDQDHPREPLWRAKMIMKTGGLVLIAINTVLLLVLIAVATSLVRPPAGFTEQEAAMKTSFYSPLLEPSSGVIEYEYREFVSGFESKTPYKGQPSKELDRAWEELTYVANNSSSKSAVDGDVLDRLGVPRTAVRYSDDDGGKYLVSVEVFHQLHCLNLVRMYTYRDYYDRPENRPPEFADPEWVVRLHVDHCIDTLRQALACQADVGLLPHYWIKGQGPNEDFSTPHRCRKMDRIVEWAGRNPLPEGKEPVPRPDSIWLDRLPTDWISSRDGKTEG